MLPGQQLHLPKECIPSYRLFKLATPLLLNLHTIKFIYPLFQVITHPKPEEYHSRQEHHNLSYLCLGSHDLQINILHYYPIKHSELTGHSLWDHLYLLHINHVYSKGHLRVYFHILRLMITGIVIKVCLKKGAPEAWLPVLLVERIIPLPHRLL